MAAAARAGPGRSALPGAGVVMRCPRCGERLPHYCPAADTGPGYPGPDPGGPDLTIPADDWALITLGDQ